MGYDYDQVVQLFLRKCEQLNVSVEPRFAHCMIVLLAQDEREGLDLKTAVVCKLERFLESAMDRYTNPCDPTICNLRLTDFFDQVKTLELAYVKESYEKNFSGRLKSLIADVLQYPETSSKTQLDEMCYKMQVFIIALYNLGSPKDHVLLSQTRRSLLSVIGKADLKDYVLRKRYHRLEYLQRLAATVAGILIYNNYAPAGEKEHMRDIVVDLKMAEGAIKESLVEAIKCAEEHKNHGAAVIGRLVTIDTAQKKMFYKWPIEKLWPINRFVILYTVHERFLRRLLAICEKTFYLISCGLKKLECVVEKINDVLRFRTAIESELIFPHFVYLSEVWMELLTYLNHMAELSKLKDQMDVIVAPEVTTAFLEAIEYAETKSAAMNQVREKTFQEIIGRTNRRTVSESFLSIRNYTADFCSLTIALTNGLVLPAIIERKLCANLDYKFGFSSMDKVRYAERSLNEFMTIYRTVIYNSVDLMLLFKLNSEFIKARAQEKLAAIESTQPKSQSIQTQTEMVVTNDLSVPNRINVTFNIWDWHRETIRLANLRKCQTHSTQTHVSYGQRNAQNQAYDTRRDV